MKNELCDKSKKKKKKANEKKKMKTKKKTEPTCVGKKKSNVICV